jgi:hypothetical protein
MKNTSARFRLKKDEIEILMQYRGIKNATDEAGLMIKMLNMVG